MNNKGAPVNLMRGELLDGVGLQPQRAVSEYNQAPTDNLLGDTLMMKDQLDTRYHINYMVKINIVCSDGPFVLPLPPLDHTFVASNNCMEILKVRGFFLGLAFDDPY